MQMYVCEMVTENLVTRKSESTSTMQREGRSEVCVCGWCSAFKQIGFQQIPALVKAVLASECTSHVSRPHDAHTSS